ncbi:HSPB1-associated protein 1 [Bulinus truncatus]|nr:HSPB1-associated protein 1 [Bulinus truncatus]
MANLKELNSPLLIPSIAIKWPCQSWTFEALSETLGSKLFSCRVSEKSCEKKMETHYIYHRITMKQFYEWLQGNPQDGPLTNYSREKYSCYIDYKYMKDLFSDIPDFFDQVQWRDFNLFDFDGYDSTVWFGSEGANTPGHQDTYGFNLVTQVYGRKLWILFPPDDSPYLYPTRIPYEESSIFTQVNLRRPDFMTHPKLKFSHPVIVVLCPGQTLYVPRHWWHYVESLEPSISINVWVPLKVDCQSHLSEAISRCLLTVLIKPLDLSENNVMKDEWLNPTETLDSVNVSLTYLKTAFDLYIKRKRDINVDVHHEQRNTREVMQEKCKVAGPEFTNNSPDSEKDYLRLLYDKLNQMTMKQVASPFQSLSINSRHQKRTSACEKNDVKKQKLSTQCAQASDTSQTAPYLETPQVSKISELDVGESEIYSLNPCSLEAYISFIDSLCLHNKCKCLPNRTDLSKNTLVNDETVNLSSTEAVLQIKSPPGSTSDKQCLSASHCEVKDSHAASHNVQVTDLGGAHRSIEEVISSLSHLDIAENLLASVLHPDVVNVMSEKFLEMCLVSKSTTSLNKA